jgi:ABC-2 type transport system ATP-binding protein
MAVDVQGLGKSFGTLRAVDDLSFAVPDGVVTGFLGPNGAGKSTAMRLMLGLDRGQGRTFFNGRPLREHPHATQVVGTHLDARPFLPGRTARDHLRMLATDAKLPAARIDEVLELVGLTTVAHKRPKDFSLGMAQRLGLAGAILANPSTLMLDEPANGLDPQSIQWLRQFLRHYASQGKAVLVSSHLLSEMQLMADHIVVIAKGKLVADGTVAELTSAHSDVLVRCSDASSLKAAILTAHPGAIIQIADGATDGDGLSVTGLDTETIGRLAFESGIIIFELSSRRASLEDTFFELTGGDQQFAFGAVSESDAPTPDTTPGGAA